MSAPQMYRGFTVDRAPFTGYWRASSIIGGYLVRFMADTRDGLRLLIRERVEAGR